MTSTNNTPILKYVVPIFGNDGGIEGYGQVPCRTKLVSGTNGQPDQYYVEDCPQLLAYAPHCMRAVMDGQTWVCGSSVVVDGEMCVTL